MTENYNKQNYRKEDTIDFIELFNMIIKRKKLIMSITILSTIISFLYVNFISKPIYSGSVTMEIGQVVNKNREKGTVQIINLESTNTLKSLIESNSKVLVTIVNNSNLVKYSYISNNKSLIKKELKEAVKLTLERDKKLAKLYSGTNSNTKYTKIVSPIIILNKPIKPNKRLIVFASFISGLIFSIIIVFFIEFLIEVNKIKRIINERK